MLDSFPDREAAERECAMHAARLRRHGLTGRFGVRITQLCGATAVVLTRY